MGLCLYIFVEQFTRLLKFSVQRSTQNSRKMSVFLQPKWEDLSQEERSRSSGAFLAFTTGLEEGNLREQFKAVMDPMMSLQDTILDLKDLQAL